MRVMVFGEWLIEHVVEIASLIVTLAGFGFATRYLLKIEKNQRTLLINSPNSQVVQITGDVTNSQINHFNEGSKKVLAFSEEATEEETSAKKLINKIENYLDENKPVSLITVMSLRLAKILKMKNDEEWLSKEVYGFKEFLKESEADKGKGLQMKKSDERYQYRGVDAELNLQFNQRDPQSFPLRIFISQPLSQIEDLVGKIHPEISSERISNLLVMHAPPLQLMVETLHIDPDQKVPYIIDRSSLAKILSEVRLKIIDFIERAKEEIK